MSLDQLQFRKLLVRPTLQALDLWSESAENLMIGTALVESSLIYIKQLKGGVAVSLYDIEPATYSDLRSRLMLKLPNLHDKIKIVLNMPLLPINSDYLMGNITAAIIFARLKYYMSPDPLPEYNNAQALADYHKKIYNTNLGATNPTVSFKIFRDVILSYTFGT